MKSPNLLPLIIPPKWNLPFKVLTNQAKTTLNKGKSIQNHSWEKGFKDKDEVKSNPWSKNFLLIRFEVFPPKLFLNFSVFLILFSWIIVLVVVIFFHVIFRIFEIVGTPSPHLQPEPRVEYMEEFSINTLRTTIQRLKHASIIGTLCLTISRISYLGWKHRNFSLNDCLVLLKFVFPSLPIQFNIYLSSK